jgi:biopolymer transport protein ExbD
MKKLLILAMAFAPLLAGSEITSINLASASKAAVEPNTPQQLTRKVRGQTLTSTQLPAAHLKFDKAFKYAGGQSFVLYGVANAEQHFFVDADKQARIKRFYWVQFEGYLPNNNHSYDYKANTTVDIGGLNFIADAYPLNFKINPGRSDSDGARARAFLESKGYRMTGDDILFQRLLHLVDKAKRNELMIVYIEDLSGMGLSAADLAKNGAAAARWDEISKGLLNRAIGGIRIVRG